MIYDVIYTCWSLYILEKYYIYISCDSRIVSNESLLEDFRQRSWRSRNANANRDSEPSCGCQLLEEFPLNLCVVWGYCSISGVFACMLRHIACWGGEEPWQRDPGRRSQHKCQHVAATRKESRTPKGTPKTYMPPLPQLQHTR